MSAKCEDCSGSGREMPAVLLGGSRDCPTCNGSGFIQSSATRHINLITRLDAASEPSRELDREICKAFHAATGKTIDFLVYTESLDAAIAFVREMLPGWHWRVDYREAVVWRGNTMTSGKSKQPAIALLIAALRAAEEESK